MYTKACVVAAGLRVFKTTVSENEGGVLDILNARDGLPFDEDQPIRNGLGKPRQDRQRHYVAATGTGNCRGRAGFVVQTNYRPIDDLSFKMIDVDGQAASDLPLFSPNGKVSSIWYICQN